MKRASNRTKSQVRGSKVVKTIAGASKFQIRETCLQTPNFLLAISQKSSLGYLILKSE